MISAGSDAIADDEGIGCGSLLAGDADGKGTVPKKSTRMPSLSASLNGSLNGALAGRSSQCAVSRIPKFSD